MFEPARETEFNLENNAESLIQEIIMLLKTNNLSLSQTRALFHRIVNEIEDTPLKL